MQHERSSAINDGEHRDSDGRYWAQLRRQLPLPRFWTRWNLAYTKRVLTAAPKSDMAASLLRCWRPRIQHALRQRFGLTS